MFLLIALIDGSCKAHSPPQSTGGLIGSSNQSASSANPFVAKVKSEQLGRGRTQGQCSEKDKTVQNG